MSYRVRAEEAAERRVLIDEAAERGVRANEPAERRVLIDEAAERGVRAG